VNDPIAYHLVPADVWDAVSADEPFRAASLGDEGFAHLTHRMTDLVEVANLFYRDDPRPHVVLTIALKRLTAPWRYDGDERYPHVYGPLDRAAITEVRPIERTADGTFLPIERPDPRRPPDMPTLLVRLVDAGVRFVVIGSGGAALLGADVRPGDLDVCVDAASENLDRLGAFLVELGARPRVHVPGWVTEEEAAAWRPGHDAETMELLFETPLGDFDVLFANLAPDGRGEIGFRELAASAVGVEVEGRPVAVASAGHLVAAKLAARRPKDIRAREELERLIRDP
jgi:uncharacterized protein (DUF952 family)